MDMFQLLDSHIHSVKLKNIVDCLVYYGRQGEKLCAKEGE